MPDQSLGKSVLPTRSIAFARNVYSMVSMGQATLFLRRQKLAPRLFRVSSRIASISILLSSTATLAIAPRDRREADGAYRLIGRPSYPCGTVIRPISPHYGQTAPNVLQQCRATEPPRLLKLLPRARRAAHGCSGVSKCVYLAIYADGQQRQQWCPARFQLCPCRSQRCGGDHGL